MNTSEKSLRLYLGTSIPNAYYDTSKPVRQLIAQKWFEHDASAYDRAISVVTIEEIARVKNDEKKRRLRGLLLAYKMEVLSLTESAKDLAEE